MLAEHDDVHLQILPSAITDVFVGEGQSAQPIQAEALSEKWSRLLDEGKGRRGSIGKGRENLVVCFRTYWWSENSEHVGRILRAREKGADDRLRVSVLCPVCL